MKIKKFSVIAGLALLVVGFGLARYHHSTVIQELMKFTFEHYIEVSVHAMVEFTKEVMMVFYGFTLLAGGVSPVATEPNDAAWIAFFTFWA